MATGRIPTTANSPLTAKGDLFTFSTGSAKLAVGNNGDTLVADSSATTGLRWSSTPSASNPVLNSAFDIWQRGTSTTNAGSGFYLADRWQHNTNASGRTISRQATGDTTNLPFIQYCLRVARDNANTNTNSILTWQPMETVNSIPLAGKTVTLSFYARKGANYSATDSRLTVYLIAGTGTDQNPVTGTYSGVTYPINNQGATLTTTWQRFTFTGTIGATMTELSPYFDFTPTGTAGAADYFEVTGVQIDVGSVALPFRRNAGTIQGELAACQRYYFRNTGNTAYAPYGIGGNANSGTSVYFSVPYPVQLRSAPTAVDYSTLRVSDGTNASAVTAISLDVQSTAYYANIGITVASGLTQYRGYTLQGNNSTSAYLGFTAEL